MLAEGRGGTKDDSRAVHHSKSGTSDPGSFYRTDPPLCPVTGCVFVFVTLPPPADSSCPWPHSVIHLLSDGMKTQGQPFVSEATWGLRILEGWWSVVRTEICFPIQRASLICGRKSRRHFETTVVDLRDAHSYLMLEELGAFIMGEAGAWSLLMNIRVVTVEGMSPFSGNLAQLLVARHCQLRCHCRFRPSPRLSAIH